jgi:hypothetical protein
VTDTEDQIARIRRLQERNRQQLLEEQQSSDRALKEINTQIKEVIASGTEAIERSQRHIETAENLTKSRRRVIGIRLIVGGFLLGLGILWASVNVDGLPNRILDALGTAALAASTVEVGARFAELAIRNREEEDKKEQAIALASMADRITRQIEVDLEAKAAAQSAADADARTRQSAEFLVLLENLQGKVAEHAPPEWVTGGIGALLKQFERSRDTAEYTSLKADSLTRDLLQRLTS